MFVKEDKTTDSPFAVLRMMTEGPVENRSRGEIAIEGACGSYRRVAAAYSDAENISSNSSSESLPRKSTDLASSLESPVPA